MQRDQSFTLNEGANPCSTKLLHVSPTAQNLANVVAQLPYVGSSLTSNLEKNVPPIHLKEIHIVYLSYSKPTLNRSADRRTLIDGSAKLA